MCLILGPFGSVVTDLATGFEFDIINNTVTHICFWSFTLLGFRTYAKAGFTFDEEVI